MKNKEFLMVLNVIKLKLMYHIICAFKYRDRIIFIIFLHGHSFFGSFQNKKTFSSAHIILLQFCVFLHQDFMMFFLFFRWVNVE